MTVSVTLPFPPSTNGLFANGKSGRYRTQRYEDWIYDAGFVLLSQRPAKIKGPVSLNFVFQYEITKHKRDLSNLLKAAEDLLVTHKVIEADDHTIVKHVSAGWSNEVEGVCITITNHEAQP